MIGLNGLNKFFYKGRSNEIHVINDVTLQLPEKGMVAIFGKSGCGKTTLLNVIGGLDSFESGTLTIEGDDIRKNTDELRNKYVGYIFQNYNLNKSESCYDNVANALRLCGMKDGEEMDQRVNAALSNVGMANYQKRTPDTLSGGQQQRIAIARAIVKNPKIILADEPTGNLDEANTVMIMDLLKQIAKDHLVLLVTHEADLVDYYCDTIIELSDGKVVNVRQNNGATGYSAKDKNDIYLGELDKNELGDTNTAIEYYGASPDSPIKLKVVNHGGKIYLKVETPNVQILDGYSEVKLREGVYTQEKKSELYGNNIDMSRLPPVEGEKYGKLFTFWSSVKSGYAASFGVKKRGFNMLKLVMVMFAIVLVFTSSVFGTSIAGFLEAKSSYNHNVFYVYTPDGATSLKLNSAVGAEGSGIDYAVLYRGNYPDGDKSINFIPGYFETFSHSVYDGFRANVVYLSTDLAKDMELVAGKKDSLKNEEMLITTAVADKLLEKSTLGYITEYRDLIGLITQSIAIEGKNLRIAGIVKSEESAAYIGEYAMAKYVMVSSQLQVAVDREYGYEVAPGETVFYHPYENIDENGNPLDYPEVGETVIIRGRELKVVRVIHTYNDYRGWLEGNGIKKLEWLDYANTYYPEMGEKEVFDAHYTEWIEYCYSDLDSFLIDYRQQDPYDIILWMATEKNIDIAKYTFANGFALSSEYYATMDYKSKYGELPTAEQLYKHLEDLEELDISVKNEMLKYEEQFYNSNSYYDGYRLFSNTYIVDETDFIAFSKQLGETHSTAYPEYYYYEKNVSYAYDLSVDMDIYYGSICYTVLHSSDPDATAKWLATEFGDITPPYEYMRAILTPDNIFEQVVSDGIETILSGFITMGIILLILSICMYFIMRSSIMNRVKEVGIYRAIGVSKKNLIFKFLIESVVLTGLTVFVGYLVASIFITACHNASPLVAEMLYYPLWFALVDLIIIVGLCLICGILPILLLLKKTPSAILAKYDI